MVADAIDLFRTRDHVADFDRYVKEFATRSTRSQVQHKAQIDVPYGEGKNEKLDLFMPDDITSPCPIHLFIHGGYWRMFSKNDFSFVADTVVAAGGIAAIMDYDLMPEVRMDAIVTQVRRAAAWLVANATRFGGDPERLSISGHSAGAHLCCTLLETDAPVSPEAALLLSGIYDLKPLQSSFLQPLIGLTDAEIADFSPVTKTYRSTGQALLLVGELETAPFHTQAYQMHLALATHGTKARRMDLPDLNHMSIALELGDKSTAVGQLLTGVIQNI